MGVGIAEGGTKDLIKNGYNGFLVKKRDKRGFVKSILKLLSNKKLYTKMRENSMEKIREQDLRLIINQWEKEYARLIKLYKQKKATN